MKKILSDDGSYSFMSFKGSQTIWMLVGSESNGELMNTIDTFRNESSEYRSYQRHQVKEQEKLGHITPVLESEIKVKVYTKEESKKRRAV